jgi:hypothetical protein
LPINAQDSLSTLQDKKKSQNIENTLKTAQTLKLLTPDAVTQKEPSYQFFNTVRNGKTVKAKVNPNTNEVTILDLEVPEDKDKLSANEDWADDPDDPTRQILYSKTIKDGVVVRTTPVKDSTTGNALFRLKPLKDGDRSTQISDKEEWSHITKLIGEDIQNTPGITKDDINLEQDLYGNTQVFFRNPDLTNGIQKSSQLSYYTISLDNNKISKNFSLPSNLARPSTVNINAYKKSKGISNLDASDIIKIPEVLNDDGTLPKGEPKTITGQLAKQPGGDNDVGLKGKYVQYNKIPLNTLFTAKTTSGVFKLFYKDSEGVVR